MLQIAESAFMLGVYGNEGTVMALGITGLIYIAYRCACNAIDEGRREE